MILLHPDLLSIDETMLESIEEDTKAIYRLLVFSDDHQSVDLLDRYHEAVHHLREVLSMKNAQQEAQSEKEAAVYLAHLKDSLAMIIGEIAGQRNLRLPVDLFRLFRAIAPEAATRHPNRYRQSLVRFGRCLAPPPEEVEGLVHQLFDALPDIAHPAVRAVYLHHELVRIHPFVDGNGRVSRMAKNWLLMFELYPPIFIYAGADREKYIRVLEKSFLDVEANPHTFHESTRQFFQDELLRIKASTGFLLNRMRNLPDDRFGPTQA